MALREVLFAVPLRVDLACDHPIDVRLIIVTFAAVVTVRRIHAICKNLQKRRGPWAPHSLPAATTGNPGLLPCPRPLDLPHSDRMEWTSTTTSVPATVSCRFRETTCNPFTWTCSWVFMPKPTEDTVTLYTRPLEAVQCGKVRRRLTSAWSPGLSLCSWRRLPHQEYPRLLSPVTVPSMLPPPVCARP